VPEFVSSPQGGLNGTRQFTRCDSLLGCEGSCRLEVFQPVEGGGGMVSDCCMEIQYRPGASLSMPRMTISAPFGVCPTTAIAPWHTLRVVNEMTSRREKHRPRATAEMKTAGQSLPYCRIRRF